MKNFSIALQIENEIKEFYGKQIKIASIQTDTDSVRYLKPGEQGYFFNQARTITLIDLYWNSKHETGEKDRLKQRKMFLNIGKFRSQVSAKQIDIDSKNFLFLPDAYADPFTAIFMQKDFRDWVKTSDFAVLLNECVEKFPKYGTVVLKKVGKEIKFVPLQNLINDQTAESLQKARYVSELHPEMSLWEMQEMKGWNCDGLTMKMGETRTVCERHGRVPLGWLNHVNGRPATDEDWQEWVDAKTITCKDPSVTDPKRGVHILFAEQIDERPYEEVHWDRQHGRWLGIGVMEDQFENQVAKNIIINLIRRSLHWSARRLFQSQNSTNAGKNLIKDVDDGEVLEVGQNGEIREVVLPAKVNSDFATFLREWETNSDQKAFTYESITGESMPSGTPFSLGVMVSKTANLFFDKKREQLGLFLKRAIENFVLPEFVRDMSRSDRVMEMFSSDAGFEILKKAGMDYIRGEVIKASLLSGKPVDDTAISQAIEPIQAVQSMLFFLSSESYKNARYKFDFTVTGEEIDLEQKIESLKTLHQLLSARNDSRAEKVLARISALAGEHISQFGEPTPVMPSPTLPVANGQPVT